MPVAMSRETEEAMPARALEASVWEALLGIQVNCEQGPPRHRASTRKGLSLRV